MPEVRVGIVDSGHGLPAERVLAAQCFRLGELGVQPDAIQEDALGHGSAVAEAIFQRVPEARFCIAQVFDGRGVTSASQVAAAIDWLVGCGVRVINLSLGLRDDRPALRQACAAAVEAGVLVCASNPAQGMAVFPAAYPGVWRVTGDARCQPDQWTFLNTPQADFAACVRGSNPRLAGASLGCAAFTGHLAAFLHDHPQASNEQAHDWLQRHAAFHGREFREAP